MAPGCYKLRLHYQAAEKLNCASHGEERKRRGNLKVFDFIVTGIASLRSQ
jgi:hypothetical protein